MRTATRYIFALVASSLIGFGMIYLSSPKSGNALRAQSAASPATATDARGGLAAAAKGGMAAFVVKKDLVPVPAIQMVDGDGKPVSLSDWNGKIVLLNLWATWCAPCLKEMPSLDRLKSALGGDNFDVVAVSIDRGPQDKPKGFFAKAGIKSLRFLQDPSGRAFADLKTPGMPTTVLIDRKGRELGRLVGPAEWDEPDAQALIKAAIAATGG
jgi:thiol-disulfide isomerase/thioredoxin